MSQHDRKSFIGFNQFASNLFKPGKEQEVKLNK